MASKVTASKVRPIPDGYHVVTPYLCLRGAAAALEFYERAFGATEIMRMPAPDGKIGHAEIKIGDSRIMLADEVPGIDFLSPQSCGGTAVHIHLYVEDVDAFVTRAIAGGGELKRPVQDQFYGDRLGTLKDPFGHVWHVATHKEDLSPEELGRRAKEAMKTRPSQAGG